MDSPKQFGLSIIGGPMVQARFLLHNPRDLAEVGEDVGVGEALGAAEDSGDELLPLAHQMAVVNNFSFVLSRFRVILPHQSAGRIVNQDRSSMVVVEKNWQMYTKM